jgi:uncharacterized protein YlaI
MHASESATHTFVCPECDERLAVERWTRATLVAKGCVACGCPVTGSAFRSPGG